MLINKGSVADTAGNWPSLHFQLHYPLHYSIVEAIKAKNSISQPFLQPGVTL